MTHWLGNRHAGPLTSLAVMSRLPLATRTLSGVYFCTSRTTQPSVSMVGRRVHGGIGGVAPEGGLPHSACGTGSLLPPSNSPAGLHRSAAAAPLPGCQQRRVSTWQCPGCHRQIHQKTASRQSQAASPLGPFAGLPRVRQRLQQGMELLLARQVLLRELQAQQLMA